MPKFTFICEHESAFTGDTVSTITVQSKRDRLDHVLEDVKDFLLGCGYVVDGDLQVVSEEDQEEVHFDFNNMTCTVSDDFFANNMNCDLSITTSGCDDITTITGGTEHNDYYYDINRNR